MAYPRDHADIMASTLTQIVEDILRSPCVRRQLSSFIRDELDMARSDAIYEFEDARRRTEDHDATYGSEIRPTKGE